MTTEHKPHSIAPELRSFIERCDQTSIGMYLVEFDMLAKRLACLEEQLKAAGNELAQERSRPGGSFDQWAELQRLEEQLQTAQEELRENDRLVESAWAMRDAETEKAKRAEEQLKAVEEKLARALYEKAMEERRTCLAGFRQDKRWDDDPYVSSIREGESRPTDWRDGWREQARYFLSDTHPATKAEEGKS